MEIKQRMNSVTQSLCPVCLEKISAQYTEDGGEVYLEKTCPQHGDFKTLAWEKGPDFFAWDSGTVHSRPQTPTAPVERGCPRDCGLCAKHQQAACCVLIEITQRCNQHCPYCFAMSEKATPEEDYSLDEMDDLLNFLRGQSGDTPFNLQLSGGEPTLHPHLPQIISLCREKGFSYVQINTNGRRLAEEDGYAKSLRKAGLDTVFLQFDGTREDIYRALRGQALLETKKRAIQNSVAAGLGVVLVVMVVPGINDDNLGEIMTFAGQNVPKVRGVHLQPVSYFGRFPRQPANEERITLSGLISRLEAQTDGLMSKECFVPLESGHGCCSFHGNFMMLPGQTQALSQKQAPGREHSIEKARAYLAKKWGPENPCGCNKNRVSRGATLSAEGYDPEEWAALAKKLRQHTLSVTAMAFQDAWTVDLNRLRRCRLHVATRNKNLVPFCAFNITSQNGKRLHTK